MLVESVFGCELAGTPTSHSSSRCNHQWTIGAGECVAQCFDRASIFLAIGYEIRKIVIESTMDNGLRFCGSLAQALEIFERAAMNFGASGGE